MPGRAPHDDTAGAGETQPRPQEQGENISATDARSSRPEAAIITST